MGFRAQRHSKLEKEKVFYLCSFQYLNAGFDTRTPRRHTHTHTLKANQEIESMMVPSYGFFTRVL